MGTNLTADTYRRFFSNKKPFHCGKIVAFFGPFPGDKGDNIDMWMIKITIKANQIDMDALLISEVDNIQNHVVSEVQLFPLICWFVHFTLKDKHGAKNLYTLGFEKSLRAG